MREFSKAAWLPALVILFLGLGLYQTKFTPIYSDEVAYKIFLERFFINGGFKQSVTPFCDNFLMRPGVVLLPAAWFWSIISWLGSDWFSYRLAPYVGLGIIFTVLIRTNIRRGHNSFWPLLLLVTMGPALYGYILLRPEIIITALCVVLYALFEVMLKTRHQRVLYLLGCAVLLIYSLAAYVHPKALYLIAVVITIFITTSLSISKLPLRFVYLSFFLFGAGLITSTALQLHVPMFLQCKSLPEIERTIETVMGEQAVNPLDLAQNPQKFIENMGTALGYSSWQKTAARLTYQRVHQGALYPPKQQLSWLDVMADMGILIVLSTLFFSIIFQLRACFLHIQEPLEKRRLIVVASVAASLLVPFLFNLTKHFYEESFLLGSLMIISVLLWSFDVRQQFPYHKYLKNLFPLGMLAVSLLCIVCSYNDFTRPLVQGYEGSSISYKTDMDQLGRNIRHTLEAASVPSEAHLVVDDLTYDAVRQYPVVLPITYLLIVQKTPGAMRLFMDKYQARYGITSCYNLNRLFAKEVPVDTLAVVDYTPVSEGIPPGICLFKLK
jgi:hypothetical protein